MLPHAVLLGVDRLSRYEQKEKMLSNVCCGVIHDSVGSGLVLKPVCLCAVGHRDHRGGVGGGGGGCQ